MPTDIDDTNSNRVSWDKLSFSYGSRVSISLSQVHYGPNGPGEDELKLLPASIDGCRVLDLGCGSGENSVALARMGALVTGVDFSSAQIRNAKALAARANTSVEFICDDISSLSQLADAQFDFAISCFSTEYISDLSAFLSIVFSHIKPRGFLLLADLHPFASSANVTSTTRQDVFDSLRYFSTGLKRFSWDGDPELPFVRHHRTLEDYMRCIAANKLHIATIREPIIRFPPKRGRDPYFDHTLTSRDDVWRYLPYTMVIKLYRLADGEYDDSYSARSL